ncbi:cold-regulated 413 plasma membrane protein 2-like [Amaranthus tricolor]|uniref:cold-regulated 413 plasma membrane protein 2-like n=1 Tax=Amaranthus tricolor TaxID=29722 RepID=UPI0025877394|nr:cold-regulated 413 plasma membrane protein 2-like [Amaranthus tricolor]XP_057527533.1 cold-regulated 413 plasma membrane protein 2-like [Amaranthus tricolor]
MKKVDYLKMKTEDEISSDQIFSDMNEIANAAKKLVSDSIKLGGLGFGTTFLQWVASFAAIYLLVLDRTNWKTNILTGLLVPYIFFSLPGVLFSILRGQVGMWIAFVAVILRLFFPHRFPDWLELPGAMILIIAVAPNLFAHTIRGDWIGAAICLAIGCYLLQEHIRASGGFRNSFTRAHAVSNSIGIILLLVYPVWFLITHFV